MKGRLAGQMIQLRSRLIETVGKARRAYLQIFGIPDYERYLAHMRSAHPGDRVMTETEFNHTRMNDRYNKPGSKCC